jgi:hypothetical protein
VIQWISLWYISLCGSSRDRSIIITTHKINSYHTNGPWLVGSSKCMSISFTALTIAPMLLGTSCSATIIRPGS